jgi:flagellar FliL protein
MAKATSKKAEKSIPQKSSILGTLVGFVLVTALAATTGVAVAWQLQSLRQGASAKPSDTHAASGAAGHAPNQKIVAGTIIKPLPTILTNLAGQNSKKTWVRLDLSVLLPHDMQQENELPAVLAQDIIAFLRTVSTTQIEGPAGFQGLREDLEDIVRIRSQGKARGMVIRSFIIE